MSDRPFIIGAGKVGRGLALALRHADIEVVGVHSRVAREGATSSGALPRALAEANIVIIAVRESDIAAVIESLVAAARAPHPWLTHGCVMLSTSGIASSDELDPLRSIGYACGTFHPLAPFSSAARGAAALHDGWVGIDGDATACAASRRLAAALGARTLGIPRGHKSAYHAAAVIASNFPIVLAALAEETLTAAGVDRRAARDAVQHLMAVAVSNLADSSPRDALTGPIARGDERTVEAHRAALAESSTALAVYDALAAAARELVRDHPATIDDASVGRRNEIER